MRGIRLVAALWFASLLWVSGTGRAGESKPTKELAVKVLNDLNNALEAKDIDKAMTLLHVPPKAKDKIEELKKDLLKLAGRKEISKKGIAVLAAKGKWGKIAEVVDAAGVERFVRGRDIKAEDCYGLFAGERQGAAFHWNGKQFQVIYFNNIGYLEESR